MYFPVFCSEYVSCFYNSEHTHTINVAKDSKKKKKIRETAKDLVDYWPRESQDSQRNTYFYIQLFLTALGHFSGQKQVAIKIDWF